MSTHGLMSRRSRASVFVALTALVTASAFAQTSYQPTEIEVKAAFLYHFAQLVTWPEGVESDPDAPMVIAIVGPDPFGEKLEATIGDQKVKGHPLKIVRVASASELTTSPQIVFVGAADRYDIDKALTALGKTPVLTVSAANGFARKGGMIEFRLTRDRRVTFDINVQAAASAGLKMSSQLLKIAHIVEPSR
ncbi:MAG: YfiR family protein [Vicinamibacteria bacterium]